MDGTLLDDRTALTDVALAWRAVAPRVEIVLASSRTVEELIELLCDLQATADLIAENGACTAVRSVLLARALGARETVTRGGQRWYVTCRAAPVDRVVTVVRRVRARHAADVTLATELPPRRQSQLLGGTRQRAQRALARRASVLAVPPHRSESNDAWLATLRRTGFQAVVGGQWLTIWRGPDKGEAARAYLAARGRVGKVPAQVAAIGDAENDVPLLTAVSNRFVVRRPSGEHDPSLAAIPATIALASAGHLGWREAMAQLLCTAALPGGDVR